MKKIFNVEETSNKQNDRAYAPSSKGACELVPWNVRGHYTASMIVWCDGVTCLSFCDKDVITAARNYQQYILAIVVELLNQTVFQNRPGQYSAPARKAKTM